MVRRFLPKLRLRWTIKGRIALAFVSMSAAAVALGILTASSANRAADLVRLTYDQVVVANSFARAVSSDFANLRSNLAQQLLQGGKRDHLDPVGAALQASLQSDLAIAVEKAASPQVLAKADEVRESFAQWQVANRKATADPASLADMDKRARQVEGKVEALVTLVAEQGFSYRNDARSFAQHDVTLALAGVGGTVLIAGIVALMLFKRISGPVGGAAHFAREIAAGTMGGDSPPQPPDEIGDLIGAMVVMRGEVNRMMVEQVALREQSQARVAEALEGLGDGVVIVDADGVVRIVNGQALDCLGLGRDGVAAEETVRSLLSRMGRAGEQRHALLTMGASSEVEDTRLPDGRWIRNSRHRTTDGGMVALYSDISASRLQQERIAEANRTLDAALANMSQGLCLFDDQNRLKLANARFMAMFGAEPEACLPGTPYQAVVARAIQLAGGDPATLPRLMRHERALLAWRPAAGRAIELGSRTIQINHKRLPDGGWIATYEDITERKRAETQIVFLANHDPLTRLPNRTMLAKRVNEALSRARRGNPFAVLCLDLDNFKPVNDTLGHAIGDELLRAVTDRLLGCVRTIDTVARLGGDEFAIVQADIAGPDQVIALARRLVEAVAAPYVIDGNDIQIAVSIGIALAPQDGTSHGVLLKSADAALYRAKEDGRRTFRFFELAMDETLQARHALEADLRRALVNDEFEVFYQPLLDVKSAAIRGFEALVRWRHPVRGLVAPDEFIPIAEETGAIKEIGRRVLQMACLEAVLWPGVVRVAVNVSTVQLREADFLDEVTDALRGSGLAPDRLELEITESVFIANTGAILPLLNSLRGLGVHFSIDDFGTGYSSLSTLRSFPFEKIKIDRSFIRDTTTAPAAGQIIRTIVALGRSLGMRVTAEGVETRAQLEFLAQEGCDEIQGYLVGRPGAAEDARALLARDAIAAELAA